MFDDVFNNKRVLVTGHTGFKGSWLILWLKKLKANVYGLSLPFDRENNQHWGLLNEKISGEFELDIGEFKNILNIIKQIRPEIIFHMAAQPLVSFSYQQPRYTWNTNLMGTCNLLEAIRVSKLDCNLLFVTTDKVYLNPNKEEGCGEADRLGGHDPYSASKAASEILIDSYRSSFFNDHKNNVLIASARAGNVIGGGDWSENRLIPDLFRAYRDNRKLVLRRPHATRPWQHVLDSLSGYLVIGQQLLLKNEMVACPWNFGPNPSEKLNVLEACKEIKKYVPNIEWKIEKEESFYETESLLLNTRKARDILNWQPVWQTEDAIEKTTKWYKEFIDKKKTISSVQLEEYFFDAKNIDVKWAR